jgi:hypothetical protein
MENADPVMAANFKCKTHLSKTVSFFELIMGHFSFKVGEKCKLDHKNSIFKKYQEDYQKRKISMKKNFPKKCYSRTGFMIKKVKISFTFCEKKVFS